MKKKLFAKIQLNNHYSNGTIWWNLIQIESDETFVNEFTVKLKTLELVLKV